MTELPEPSPAPRPRRPWYVRLLFRVVAMGLSLMVALALGEVAVRLLVPQQGFFAGRGLYAPDPDLGHVLKPNLRSGGIQTNAHGFRDRDYTVRKPAGTYRVVGIGDSFTFGACAVEDTFLDQLERRLAASSPTPVEVINTGVSGYNTRQAVVHLKKYGMPFQPDAVILAFFLGNDIQENQEDVVFDVVDGELVNQHRRPGPLRRLLMRSHLFRLFTGSLLREARAAEGLPDFLDIELNRLQVCRKELAPEREEGYRLSERYIVELGDYLRDRGVELIVLLIPDEVQVNPDVYQRVVEKHRIDPDDYDLLQPNRRLRAVLVRERIHFVDALWPLRKENREGRVYNVDETHLNPRGNEVVAKRLLRALRSRVPALRDWPRAAMQPRGQARPGAAVTFELEAAACPGHRYQVVSSFGYGQTPFDRIDLPLCPDNAFCASVGGGLPGVFADYAGVLDARGRGRARLQLPPLPALAGRTVHTVFLVLDPEDPERPITASEAVVVPIGDM